VIPAITGKLELVYEGEQEGMYNVAMKLLDRAIKEVFKLYFPDPEKSRAKDPFGTIKMWFKGGNTIDLLLEADNNTYQSELDKVSGLRKLLDDFNIVGKHNIYPFMELIIHGLKSYDVIQRDFVENTLSFEDPLGSILSGRDEDDDDA
jgi:magnesium chelatase subunit I